MLSLLINGRAKAENENFSNKPAPALFNADCTGAGCHKGPQGLGKGQSQSSLAGFLREHYTNSRESAAALAAYILKVPAGPAQAEPKPTRASTQRQGGERESRGGSWFDPEPSGPEGRPGRPQPEKEKEKERAKTRAAAKPPAEAKPAEPKPEAKPAEAKPAESEEPTPSAAATPEPAAEPEAKPAAPEAKPAPADRKRRTAEPVEPKPTPRNQRGRQPAVAATPPAPAPTPAEPTPPPAPAAPPPPQYDIFD